MKAAVFAAVLSVVLALASCRPDAEKYESKYDNKDIDGLLNNKEALGLVVKCLIEQGPCVGEDFKVFKEIFDGAIREDCAKCSNNQRERLSKFVSGLEKKDPEALATIGKFYNPDGRYDDKFKRFHEERAKH